MKLQNYSAYSCMRKPVTVEFRDDVFQFLFGRRELRKVNGKYYRKMILATLASLLTNTACLINMDRSIGTKIAFSLEVRRFIDWPPTPFLLRTSKILPSLNVLYLSAYFSLKCSYFVLKYNIYVESMLYLR